MTLYIGKNYPTISNDVHRELMAIRESEKKGTMFGRINKFRKYPKDARHNLSLFPNNYLDILELEESKKIQEICLEFKKLKHFCLKSFKLELTLERTMC